MITLLTLFLTLSSVYAQPVRELEQYLESFNVKPLSKIPAKRQALFDLGKKLFEEPLVSGKNNIACIDCHGVFSSDGLPLGLGEGAQGRGSARQQATGKILARHTQSLFNMGFPDITEMFWDGRVRKNFAGGWTTPEPQINGKEAPLKELALTFDSLLAVQAVFPISNPDEMLGQGSSLSNLEAWESVMRRLLQVPQYKKLLSAAYPEVTQFNIAHVGNALAEFERHEFLAVNTPWDLYLQGKKEFMTNRMKEGAKVFLSRAGCFFCHQGPHLSTFGFQSIGVPQLGPGMKDNDDKGRGEIPGRELNSYAFRIPPLRNVALTAPYMHTGSFANLREVIEHYNKPMNSVTSFKWDPRHTSYREDLILNEDKEVLRLKAKSISRGLSPELRLTEVEKSDLLCFLTGALTDLKYQSLLRKKFAKIENCLPPL